MLERRRKNKHYDIVPGEEDLELGEQETGRIGGDGEEDAVGGASGGEAAGKRTVSEELDQWDENADDEWDDSDVVNGGIAEGAAAAVGDEDSKKRAE